MRRRAFLRTTAGALAAGALGGCTSGGGDAPPGEASFTLWSWVHGDRDRTPQGWRDRFARIRAAGVSGVLIGGADPGAAADAARAEGLEVHRWFWTCNRNGDAWARENHPEWFTVSRTLESSLTHPPYVDYYRWVCPTREPVRAYLRGLVDGLAADPRWDGVHLDYVRHADVILPRGLWDTYGLVQDVEHPEFDFCYCEVCRARFAALDGRDPLEIPDPPSDEAWRRFRWDAVTGLVRDLAEAVHARAKPLSAAVFPTPDLARRLVRQDWDAWPLDRVFPMLYQGFYLEDLPWIGACVREGVAASGGTPLHAGLYLPDLDPAALAEALRIARDAGAAGASFFEMDGLGDAHLEAVAAAVAEVRA